MTDSYDCVVVGDDIAAYTAAMLVGQSGLKTLLLSSHNASPDCGDLLLPCCRRTLERLGIVDRLDAFKTSAGQSLQLLDASGNALLALGGDQAEPSRFWRLTPKSLLQVLKVASQQLGVQLQSIERPVQIQRIRPGCWRAKSHSYGEPRHWSASLIVDARAGVGRTSKWAQVWGYYRNLTPVDPSWASVAIRPLDRNGWCSLTPANDGLTCVRAVFSAVSPGDDDWSSAEVFEDRLVQCPTLLERMLAAELVGDLVLAPAGGLVDPWPAFASANDLLVGEQLAGRALEAFQTGQFHSIQAPLQPRLLSGLPASITALLELLFNPKVDQPGFFEQRSDLVQALNSAVGDCQPTNSPFPPTGDKAILTRA